MPIANYNAKIIKDLGLHYEKIDAYKNDCVIYYKEHAQHLNVQFVEFQDGRLKERAPINLQKRFRGRSYVTFLLHKYFKGYSCHPKLLET